LSGFFGAKYLILNGSQFAKPDRLSGFWERVMEQNQTLNAAHIRVDGTAPLEVGTWLGLYRARGIRQIIFNLSQLMPISPSGYRELASSARGCRAKTATVQNLLLSFKNTKTEHKCSVFRSVLLTSNELLI
jgi:hypothetical protein